MTNEISEKEAELLAALDKLKRYKPHAKCSIVVDSNFEKPYIVAVADMTDTGNAVSQGYGEYVRYHDVLSMICAAWNTRQTQGGER